LSQREALYQTTIRTGTLAQLLDRLSVIFVLLAFVALGNGFMYAVHAKKAMYQNILLFAMVGVSILLLALALAYFGKINALYTGYLNYVYSDLDDFDFLDFENGLRIVRKLGSTFEILCFVVSVPLIAYGGVAVHTHRHNPMVKGVGISLETLAAERMLISSRPRLFSYLQRSFLSFGSSSS
jgi:hypothetical protein